MSYLPPELVIEIAAQGFSKNTNLINIFIFCHKIN